MKPVTENQRLSLLVVDDDIHYTLALKALFEMEGYFVTVVKSGLEAIDLIHKESYPVVICDIRMLAGEGPGASIISFIKEKGLPSAVVLTTGAGSVEGALEAYKKGAFDYIGKSYELQELKGIVARALKHALRSGKPIIKVAVPSEPRPLPSVLVGHSLKMLEIYKKIAKAGISSSYVLIEGETGTGKELVARAIHENSSRCRHPFVAINCGAITDSLLESELFGYVRGAFTGATEDKRGLFEEAHMGTLFLDEIGDIAPALQVKLLRALQDGEIRPVGSSKVKKVDVRVISATHRNLEQMVKTEKFRQDLFYRLNVIRISLPSLRERLEDLGELLNHFIIRFCERLNRQIESASPETLEMLNSYGWPGNVRELENAVERAVNMAQSSVLFPEDFPEEIQWYNRIQKLSPEERSLILGSPSGKRRYYGWKLDDVEKDHIMETLKEVGFNRSKAAIVLGIDRATLYRKAQRYGIPFGKASP